MRGTQGAAIRVSPPRPVQSASDLLPCRMARNCGRYWVWKRQGNEKAAARAHTLLVQDFHRCHWKHAPWRGANLGGWFLLEPGPASPLFQSAAERCGVPDVGGSEWDLCVALDAVASKSNGEGADCAAAAAAVSSGGGGGGEGAEARGGVAREAVTTAKAEVLDEHRARHYSSETMEAIKSAGLNAVRIPIGYWIITGPTHGDAYHGPALDQLDLALSMAATAGLQVSGLLFMSCLSVCLSVCMSVYLCPILLSLSYASLGRTCCQSACLPACLSIHTCRHRHDTV